MIATYSAFVFLVILITGGQNLKTEELFLPSAGTSCILPPLSTSRVNHIVGNNILCGGTGSGVETSCLQWSPDTGAWEDFLTLWAGRGLHVAWTPRTDQTYLIGGFFSETTSTRIRSSGVQEQGFELKHSAM